MKIKTLTMNNINAFNERLTIINGECAKMKQFMIKY